ncbi:M16 family metallopeptidase [Methylobacterium bullatum]|uniref:Putative zinc protease n=1 Tax=Methylobacterium bullatum TaxID=570505 RepID=A0A679JMF8_9HYPH|nr:putative zinc protease [Methylobacterium bullatum]
MTIHIPPPGETNYAKRIRTVRSPKGIEAWLIEDHTLPILSVNFGFKGGTSLDPEDRCGAASLLSALLTEGAGALGGAEFQEALADKAIHLSFHTTPDLLAGQIKCLVRHAERTFDLLGSALSQPAFASEAIEQVRARTVAHLRSVSETPDFTAARTFAKLGFAGHVYARPTLGTTESVTAISREDLLALHPRLINRTTLRIAVVGATTPEHLGALLDRAFAKLPAGLNIPLSPTAIGCLGQRHVVQSPAPQSTLVFGRPGILLKDPDFLAAFVVNHCLGGGSTSRLFREVREKRGLCYSIGSVIQTQEGCSTWRGSTSVRNDRVKEALAVIEAEIRHLTQCGIGEDELSAAKGYLIGSYSMALASSAALAGRLLAIQVSDRGRDWLDRRNRGVASVDVADVARAIDRLFGDGALFVVAAGDPKDL